MPEKHDDKKISIAEFRRELGVSYLFTRRLISLGVIQVKKEADGTLRVAKSEIVNVRATLRHPVSRARLYMRSLGPGLITGASDDDPSGIATHSAIGAQFGLSLLWMIIWLLPMMMAVQEICARIAIITNKGLAAVLEQHFHRWIVVSAVILLLLANTINIGADIGAMAASVHLLVKVNFTLLMVIFTFIIIVLEVFLPYRFYARFLKWLTLSLFSYIITAFIVHPDWLQVFTHAFVPQLKFDKNYIFAIVAFFGTSITPYLFFWQASEEVEEQEQAIQEQMLDEKSRIRWMHNDVYNGMAFSSLVSFFIMLTTAQVLYTHGITNIQTAEQAAQALRPLGGKSAFYFFTFGIIGTGMLAIPILAGSGAYALSEIMRWNEGLNKKFNQARKFYLVIAFSTIAGLLINYVGISPIKALYYSAWLNGVIAVPLLCLIVIVGDDRRIVGDERSPAWIRVFGWAAVAFSAIAVIITFMFQLTPLVRTFTHN